MTEIEKFVGGIAKTMQQAIEEVATPLLQQAQVILDEGSEEQAREFCKNLPNLEFTTRGLAVQSIKSHMSP